jgi:hypothetical protein
MSGWQRNLYVIWVAELVAIAGFSVIMPFLPYAVRPLPERVSAKLFVVRSSLRL